MENLANIAKTCIALFIFTVFFIIFTVKYVIKLVWIHQTDQLPHFPILLFEVPVLYISRHLSLQ